MRISLAALALLAGCSFDTERPAPYVSPPAASGVCGTTETLLPNLLGFVRSGKMEPLKELLERRLIPNEAEPNPDPSLRTLLGALVDLATGLGLERTVSTASIAASSEALVGLKPLTLVTLRLASGDLDGTPRWGATEAIATLVDRCEADHLLTAVEELLRLRSPVHGGRLWIAVLGDETRPLIEDPALVPFLESFESNAERGKPAIQAIIDQILTFLADENFHISRVETLLESAVYPVVSETLRLRIERLVGLLEIATSDQAGILQPLQRAIRCLMAQPEARRELVGFFYDLLTSREVGLAEILDTVDALVSDAAHEKLLLFAADLVRVLREDRDAREPIFELLIIILRRPEVEKIAPVLIELVDEEIAAELLGAVATLLGGCGRSAP